VAPAIDNVTPHDPTCGHAVATSFVVVDDRASACGVTDQAVDIDNSIITLAQ
jgi:hypothetical protein